MARIPFDQRAVLAVVIAGLRLLRRAAVWVMLCSLIQLGACSVRYQNLASQGQSQFHRWPPPKHGMYLCLSVEPGTPIRGYDERQVVAYTRNVVAFSGLQVGDRLQIILYSGGYGWLDGNTVNPFHGPRPNSTCVIPGVDSQQRPIFVIR